MKITAEQIAKAINGPWNISDVPIVDRDKLERLRDVRWNNLSIHERANKLQEGEAVLLEIHSLQKLQVTATDHGRMLLRWKQIKYQKPTKQFSEWVKNNGNRVERSLYCKADSFIYAIVTLLDDSIYDELAKHDFFGADIRETDDLERAWYWVEQSRIARAFGLQEDEHVDPWDFSAQTKRTLILLQTDWEGSADWQQDGYSDPDFDTITPDEIRAAIED